MYIFFIIFIYCYFKKYIYNLLIINIYIIFNLYCNYIVLLYLLFLYCISKKLRLEFIDKKYY